MDDDATGDDAIDRPRRRNPFAIRMRDEVRAEIEAKAARAGMSLGGFFLAAAQGPDAPRPRRARYPSPDTALLGALMAHVGKIGSNVNQLAFQANTGSWPDRFAIEEAAGDVRWIRNTLMEALGIVPPADNDNVIAYQGGNDPAP